MALYVTDDISVDAKVTEFHFSEGPSIMAEEVRPAHAKPYWVVPHDVSEEQKVAITKYSYLEVRNERI